MLGISVWCALKDAVASLADYAIHPSIDAPATPERILMGINKLRHAQSANQQATAGGKA